MAVLGVGAAVRLRLRVLGRHLRLRGRRRTRRRRGGGGVEDEEEGGREAVVLVSGMGGSVLHARRRSNPRFDLRVWVRILRADADFRKYLWSLYNPDTGGSRARARSVRRNVCVELGCAVCLNESDSVCCCAQGTWSRWTTMWRSWCRRTTTACSPSTFSILPG